VEYDDACLAVSGEDPNISIISLSETRVVSLLEGHQAPVLSLASAKKNKDLLASLDKDGKIILWSLKELQQFAKAQVKDATAIELSSTAEELYIGTRHGTVWKCSIPSAEKTKVKSLEGSLEKVRWLSALPRSLDVATFAGRD